MRDVLELTSPLVSDGRFIFRIPLVTGCEVVMRRPPTLPSICYYTGRLVYEMHIKRVFGNRTKR